MREIKFSCENTRNKENREIIESVRFENGSSVDTNSNEYKLYLVLREIVNFILFLKIYKSDLEIMQSLIVYFLKQFLVCFPGENIIPKNAFLNSLCGADCISWTTKKSLDFRY